MTTKDQVAQLIVAEAKARTHTRDECLAVMSALYQESEWNETVWDPTHTTYGVAQQDGSYVHRFGGAAAQVGAFFAKLDAWDAKPGASSDIWLNICWMQQRPNWPSAGYWLQHGRTAYLTEIKSRIATVTPYLDKYWLTTGGTPMAVSGDPIWLEDVLREALGDRLIVEDGWAERGAGGFMGTIWGTMIHHTGNVNETVKNIRDGVQQPTGWLPGPLSQGLILPNGTLHLIAVGPCNHAGAGSYGDLTNGNRDAIGFECAYSGSGKWPDPQIWTMRDAAAAVSRKIGKRAETSVCGHKEYAKPAGRKVDPGNLDMDWFRGEVNKKLDGKIPPGQPGDSAPPVVVPGPNVWIDPIKDYSDRRVAVELWQQLRGPDGRGWAQLDGMTPVDYLEHLGKRFAAIEAALKIRDDL